MVLPLMMKKGKTNFATFKELYEKETFFKIATETFQAGIFFNIFLKTHFLIKIFLQKKE